MANIQHLGTPILAQLTEPRSTVELAGLMHPTPAVGGEPGPRPRRRSPSWRNGQGLVRRAGRLDGRGRGRRVCVALRSALLRDRDAHLYAGVGVVAGSDPAAELEETEIKLQALLPLVAE